jgi:hypothetical protein
MGIYPDPKTNTAVEGRDIPSSSSSLNLSVQTSTNAGVTNYFLANKDTRFENLVFAITSGYAANPSNPYRTDEEFAEHACSLARSIAYRMDKLSST